METFADQGFVTEQGGLPNFGDLADLHMDDLCAGGKPPRRSKAATMTNLKNGLSNERISHINRAMLIEYPRKRAKKGADLVTLGMLLGVIKMINTHVAAVLRHGRHFCTLW